jgi:hypothetical protein
VKSPDVEKVIAAEKCGDKPPRRTEFPNPLGGVNVML